MIKVGKQAKVGIPPAFSQRCVIRCTDHKVAPNKNDNQMITSNWELIGYFDGKGELQTSIERNGITYKLAGLKVPAVRFTLTEKAIGFYSDFFLAATGEDFPEEFDEENPDVSFLENLCMQVLLSGNTQVYRQQLTEEEKKEKLAKGEQPVGEPILDEDGKPIETPTFYINKWLKKYSGELPEGVAPY